MFERSFLSGLAVTLLVVQACGSDDKAKKVAGDDAGMGGEAGADLGSPGSGGSAAGERPLPFGDAGGEPPVVIGGAGGEPPIPIGGAGGTPELIAGNGGQAPLEPQPELLFTVRDNALGLEGTALAAQAHTENVIYTTASASQDPIDGDNEVKVIGVDLGLGDSDAIVAFTELRANPENPMYFFSVAEGSEGSGRTRVDEAYWGGDLEESHVYFSDTGLSDLGTESGGGQGYNGLSARGVSLGLAIDGLDELYNAELRDLLLRDANTPVTELYFTTNSAAVGVTGSAVEATPVDQRGCTVFKSSLDGTNSVAFSCANLGLIDGDEIDALLVYGDSAPSAVVFSLDFDSQGGTGTAVETVFTNSSNGQATLFSSPGDGSNTELVQPYQLGLGYSTDDIDGIAVVDVPPTTVVHGANCTLSYDPLALTGGGELTFLGGSRPISPDVLVLFGATATTSRLIAYDATTCAFLQQRDMPTAFISAEGWAIAPLPGWSAATPLDDVEFLLAHDGGGSKQISRYDEAGAPIGAAIPITPVSYYDSIEALVYEPVSNRLFLLTHDFSYYDELRLWVMPRPDDSTTALDPTDSNSRLNRPCSSSARVSGTDAFGNLYLAQEQGTLSEYRICAYTPQGELLPVPAPYWWAPDNGWERNGFIVGGVAHYELTSGPSGSGPFVIERGAVQLP